MAKIKQFFNIVEKNESEVDINIYGVIGSTNESWWSDSPEGTNNQAFAFVQEFKKLDAKYEKINIHINSPGGYIDDGLAIYNAIKNATAIVHTYNDGLTASMASIIMLAGQKTHFPKTSIFHLHSASTIGMGNIQDFEKVIAELKTFNAVLIQAIADRTKLTAEEVEQKYFDGGDHYMTGEEASQVGFVDFLENTEVEMPENLKEYSYQNLLNFYNKKSENNNSIISKIGRIFSAKQTQPQQQTIINNTNSNKQMKNLQLTILATLLFVNAIFADEQDIVRFEAKQAERLNAELDRLQKCENELNAVKAEKEALNTSITEKTQEIENMRKTIEENAKQIAELTAKLDKTPATPATNVKDKTTSNDKDGADWKVIDNLEHNRIFDSRNK